MSGPLSRDVLKSPNYGFLQYLRENPGNFTEKFADLVRHMADVHKIVRFGIFPRSCFFFICARSFPAFFRSLTENAVSFANDACLFDCCTGLAIIWGVFRRFRRLC